SSTGGGYSQWQGVDLTRWQPDAALDAWGSWIYAQDLDSGRCWSAGYAPTAVMPEQPIIRFHPHMAEFIRRDEDISLKLEVTVHPHDDVEIRRVTLTNHSDQARRLRLVSYAEIILAPQIADQRHPAFNKLFIQSEYLPPQKALLFHRRPRSNQDLPVFMLHRLVSGVYDLNVVDSEPQFETDRARFLGRYQTVRSPQVLAAPQNNLSGTAGSTLDPIMALAQGIHIAPYTSVEIAFVTGAADSRAQIETLAARYGTWSAVEKTFNLARYESIRELHQANMETIQLEDSQKLLSALLYPRASMRAQSEILAANTRAQNALWTYGISGDYPIILVKIGALEQLPLIQELLLAHTYWRKRGIPITLVILNQLDTGYLRELYHQIHRLIVRADSEMWIGRHDGIFILGREQMTAEADRILLETAARVIVDGAHGGLTDQLQHLTQERNDLPAFHPTDSSSAEPSPPLLRPADWQFDNGTGGFSSDGREYQIYLEPGQATPAPWSNVIANPDFGFLVTETGGGFTWSSNSSEYRLTTWRNDPVADQPVEALYLRDEETAEIWTPTPLPAPASAPYLIRHGAGYTIFEHHSHGLEQRLTLYVAPEAPVKVVRLQVKNTWSHTRRIIATYYAEWVLGTDRTMTGMYLIPEYDGANHTLLVRNPYSLEFGEHYAFLTGPEPFFGLTTDRAEFIGNAGSLQSPAALQRIGLAGTIEAGRDICAAVQYHLDIAPGDTAEVIFVMGTGASRAEALERAQQYQNPQVVERAWTETQRLWDRVLRSVIVETPDPAVNLLMPWLLYQTIACRLWGRSAFYQSGGAFGFRDQLQDVMAVLHTRPDLARTQILRAASHQFEAGDVLHWWHPPSGRGVRTRFSDDLVWLPFVVAQYVKVTGDQSILHEEVPFLRGEPLRPGEDERYGL
ncbi:MAG: cellobiose phosphorylase, partial [Anaerolineae bacterium]|nr:cellobiose phosphorylase [Anaerolineae bacterium]